MAIGIGTAPALFGPGMQLLVTGVAGPVPSDDFLLVNFLRHSDNAGFTYGTKTNLVAGTNVVTLGWDERLGFVAASQGQGMADGTAMDIIVTQYHANLTVVDTVAQQAWGALDTHSAPWQLLHFLVTSSSSDVAAILAAVRRVFPPTS